MPQTLDSSWEDSPSKDILLLQGHFGTIKSDAKSSVASVYDPKSFLFFWSFRREIKTNKMKFFLLLNKEFILFVS
ncbi:hypothetical protein Avbf_06843 [Armadillidium vulgare]|nr:hypothetical protein Avbf_06843 [Armadillidium vulgare]